MRVRADTSFLLALAALAATVAANAAPAAGSSAPRGDPSHGRKLFLAVGCYECHGTSGVGGSDRTAPRVAPDPLPYEYFVVRLRAPIARMPIYTAAVLPDSDVADIYAYLRSIPPPEKVSEIPLLNR
jgi:mono/diheme cytochrome c family protein